MRPLTQNHTNPHATVQPAPAHGGQLITTDGRALPLKFTDLTITAKGGIARVTLKQVFFNPHTQPLLVTYKLPLPANGAVSGFGFSFDGRKITGEVDKKKQARERFERAILQGKVASLLEQDRSNQFQQEVGNIPPEDTIVCEVSIDQMLDWLPEGAWEWRFPTVVGYRYMGAQGRVKDSEKIGVTMTEDDIKTRTQIALSIGDTLESIPTSPSHDINSQPEGEDTFVEINAPFGVKLDRDIVVRWPVSTAQMKHSIDMYHAETPVGGVFSRFGLLTFVPPKHKKPDEHIPRDLIFLLDTSGSMGGAPLRQAVTLTKLVLKTLREEDQFELIEFGSYPKRWREQSLHATPKHIGEAFDWLNALYASGGTEMHTAIMEAMQPLREDSQRQVILITDGYIGFESEIIQALLERLPTESRLHTIGVGSSVNQALTKPAARAGRGVELILDHGEDPQAVADRLLRRLTAPILTDITLKAKGDISHRPMRLPDMYADSPSRILFQCAEHCDTIEIEGRTAQGLYHQTLRVQETHPGQGNVAIKNCFGREWIEDLEMKRAATHRVSEVDTQIERVALDFQVASRLTSWVAVDEVLPPKVEGPLIEEEMPHEIPFGLSTEGIGLRGASLEKEKDKETSHTFKGTAKPKPKRAERSSHKKRDEKRKVKPTRRGRSLASERGKKKSIPMPAKSQPVSVSIEENMSVGDLAHKMGVRATDVTRKLIQKGVMASADKELSVEQATELAESYGREIKQATPQEPQTTIGFGAAKNEQPPSFGGGLPDTEKDLGGILPGGRPQNMAPPPSPSTPSPFEPDTEEPELPTETLSTGFMDGLDLSDEFDIQDSSELFLGDFEDDATVLSADIPQVISEEEAEESEEDEPFLRRNRSYQLRERMESSDQLFSASIDVSDELYGAAFDEDDDDGDMIPDMQPPAPSVEPIAASEEPSEVVSSLIDVDNESSEFAAYSMSPPAMPSPQSSGTSYRPSSEAPSASSIAAPPPAPRAQPQASETEASSEKKEDDALESLSAPPQGSQEDMWSGGRAEAEAPTLRAKRSSSVSMWVWIVIAFIFGLGAWLAYTFIAAPQSGTKQQQQDTRGAQDRGQQNSGSRHLPR